MEKLRDDDVLPVTIDRTAGPVANVISLVRVVLTRVARFFWYNIPKWGQYTE
jgi:hypothetical protein